MCDAVILTPFSKEFLLLLQILVIISILSQVNPIHILPAHFFTVQFSKIHIGTLLAIPNKFVQFLPQKHAYELIYSLSSAHYMLREIHPSCSDYLNNIWQEAQITQLYIMNFFQPPLAFSLYLQNSPIYSALRCLQSEFFL